MKLNACSNLGSMEVLTRWNDNFGEYFTQIWRYDENAFLEYQSRSTNVPSALEEHCRVCMEVLRALTNGGVIFG